MSEPQTLDQILETLVDASHQLRKQTSPAKSFEEWCARGDESFRMMMAMAKTPVGQIERWREL